MSQGRAEQPLVRRSSLSEVGCSAVLLSFGRPDWQSGPTFLKFLSIKLGGCAATETNAPTEPPSLGSYGVPRRGGYRLSL